MAVSGEETQALQGPGASVQEHPLFSGSSSVGLISGENPRFPAQASGHRAMGEALKQMGLKHFEREGMYGAPEKSWEVRGPTREQMYQLGKQFGQESVVYSQGGKHELLYSNGPNSGRFHPALDHEWFKEPPEDYYTAMPELGGHLRLNFDWNTLHPTNLAPAAAVDALAARAGHGSVGQHVTKAEVKARLVATLKKALEPVQVKPHPLAYPWVNTHTDHHLHVASPGVVLLGRNLAKAMPAHPHMDGSKHVQPQDQNEQAAGAGVSTYAKYAMPYGQIDKTNPTDLTHYPYHGKSQAVNQLVKDHGYNTYYAGGKYGRPDLANRNYNSKHLMIYDPSPGSGGDFGHGEYTDLWRKLHEISHALTYPELNQIYGEGRRIGKLGTHRTLREAIRAVHWEHLAAHKQRELSKQIGVEIPDDVFNKEYATVMHDAIHRAVTGKFTEPSSEGFRPHSHQIPLETGLGMVREAAHGLGLTGMHDLIKKSEQGPNLRISKMKSGETSAMADDKVYEQKEWRQILAKAVQGRIDAYSQAMLDLRTRELKKSAEAVPAHSPAPAMIPMDACPLCGMEDLPGKCKCLQGPMASAPGAGAPLALNEVPADMEKADEAMGDPKEVVTPPAPKIPHAKTVKQPGLSKDEPAPHPDKSESETCGTCKQKVQVLSSGKLAAHDCKVSKQELKIKPDEPVKPAAGNGIKIKPLKKTGMSGMGKMPKDAQSQAAGDAFKAASSAPAVPAPAKPIKLPGAGAQAARAQTFADHMPAGKFSAGPPKLPGMGAKPPQAGVGQLKPPAAPKPLAAPAAAKPAMAAPAAPKMAPAPGAPKPMGKSEDFGSCLICKNPEHGGKCS